VTTYPTWYGFKKECESRLGRCLPNRLWLAVKPGGPLPWSDRDAEAVVSTVRNAGPRLERRNAPARSRWLGRPPARVD
jgi:hypothetical protein